MTDDFEGQGGRYLIDPKTGKRTLVERTALSEAPPVSPETVSPAAVRGDDDPDLIHR